VLEESGFAQTGSGDRIYPFPTGGLPGNADAVRFGSITPEIAIPNDAFNYQLRITHWYDINALGFGCGFVVGGDGAMLGIKSGAAGTLTADETGITMPVLVNWTAFPPNFNNNAGGTGNTYAGLSGFTTTSWGRGPGSPTSSCPASLAYVTSVYNMNAYKGQSVRMYFFFMQQRYGNFIPPLTWNAQPVQSQWIATPRQGWRIDQVQITQS